MFRWTKKLNKSRRRISCGIVWLRVECQSHLKQTSNWVTYHQWLTIRKVARSTTREGFNSVHSALQVWQVPYKLQICLKPKYNLWLTWIGSNQLISQEPQSPYKILSPRLSCKNLVFKRQECSRALKMFSLRRTLEFKMTRTNSSSSRYQPSQWKETQAR